MKKMRLASSRLFKKGFGCGDGIYSQATKGHIPTSCLQPEQLQSIAGCQDDDQSTTRIETMASSSTSGPW
jgi:hypothetical protein